MKATSKTIGAKERNKKFDYFKYFDENKGKGKPITHEQFIQLIEKSREQKLKKAS